MVAQITLASGRTLKLGRTVPKVPVQHPQLSKYLSKATPPTVSSARTSPAKMTASMAAHPTSAPPTSTPPTSTPTTATHAAATPVVATPTVTMIPASALQRGAPPPPLALTGGAIIASAPTSVHYEAKAIPALDQVYMNEQLGCCVISAMGHLRGVLTGNASDAPIVFTDQQIIDAYSAISGYRPGDPSTDNGCDEVTALGYWKTKGFPTGQNTILGWLEVDATDPVAYRTALDLFGNLIMSAGLPQKWMDIDYTYTPNRVDATPTFVWDAADDVTLNFHAVVATGYEPDGLVISTWGTIGRVTDAAIAKYYVPDVLGSLYTVLDQDWVNRATQMAPSGLDWQMLLADFPLTQAAAPSNTVIA